MPQNPATKILNLDLPCAPDALATVRAARRGAGSESDDVVLVVSEPARNNALRLSWVDDAIDPADGGDHG